MLLRAFLGLPTLCGHEVLSFTSVKRSIYKAGKGVAGKRRLDRVTLVFDGYCFVLDGCGVSTGQEKKKLEIYFGDARAIETKERKLLKTQGRQSDAVQCPSMCHLRNNSRSKSRHLRLRLALSLPLTPFLSSLHPVAPNAAPTVLLDFSFSRQSLFVH